MDYKKFKKNEYILRKLNPQDAEDIIQQVYLKILERKPTIKYNSYYYVALKNEMLNFLRKQKNKLNLEIEYGINNELIDYSLSPFNDLLYKELKKDIRDEFIKNYETANKQLKLLDYLMDDVNHEKSVKEIKNDLNFNAYDTTKANIRHIRLKLEDNVKKNLK